MFSSKDRLHNAPRSFVVYKFTCVGCQSCYIGETRRHLATTIKEHLVTDKKSHIMKHLLKNKCCNSLCDEGCFQVIDYASSPLRLKVKEALHINLLKPDLNKQKEHVNITISVYLGQFTLLVLLIIYLLSLFLLLVFKFHLLIHCKY